MSKFVAISIAIGMAMVGASTLAACGRIGAATSVSVGNPRLGTVAPPMVNSSVWADYCSHGVALLGYIEDGRAGSIIANGTAPDYGAITTALDALPSCHAEKSL